jgi:hypothetical protein
MATPLCDHEGLRPSRTWRVIKMAARNKCNFLKSHELNTNLIGRVAIYAANRITRRRALHTACVPWLRRIMLRQISNHFDFSPLPQAEYGCDLRWTLRMFLPHAPSRIQLGEYAVIFSCLHQALPATCPGEARVAQWHFQRLYTFMNSGILFPGEWEPASW